MKYQLFAIALACAFVTLAKAAPPTTGAYVSDPQSEYVQDQTSEGISQVTSILCYLSNTRPDAMVNLGKYVAFIDESKCDSASRADASNSSSEGGGSSSAYTRMSLTSTRESATSTQIGKGHAAMAVGGSIPAYVYVYTAITGAPTATNTNGALTMNFAALTVTGQNKIMRGKISTSSDGIQFSQVSSGGGGGGASTQRLTVSGNATSGSGAISYQGTTITFGYNASKFCRNDGTSTTCYSRSKADAATSTWRYGVYTDGTGARYDLAQSGFPVRNTASGEYGYASYWGIWMPTAVADGASLVSLGATPVAYTVNKTGGRLTKYTLVTKTLNEVAKVPFNYMPQATTAVTGGNLTAFAQYEMYWDGSNFIANAQMVCGSTGCFRQPLTTALTITPAQLSASSVPGGGNNNKFGVNGWSQALGGNLMIPAATLENGTPGTQPIKYNTQAVVAPGDTTVPATLKCARDCPTVASYATLTSANASNSATSPYTQNTKQKGGGTAAADVVTYTWDSAAYTLKKNDVNTAISNALLTATGISLSSYPRYASGIRSGALVDATGTSWSAGGAMDCSTNGAFFCDFKSNSLPSATFYVWENGTNAHQSATFLKKPDNTFLEFTAPQSASFEVPNDAIKYGQFAGAKMNLQFNGFGNLFGIPGKCFSMLDNAEANCGPSTRYVPAFSIPENTGTSESGKVTIGGASKWIKYLDREIRFKKIALDSSITLGSAANLPAALLLTGTDTEDPSNSSNSNYAGSVQASDFLSSPSVIHGVVQ
jgi:hypothetical protein